MQYSHHAREKGLTRAVISLGSNLHRALTLDPPSGLLVLSSNGGLGKWMLPGKGLFQPRSCANHHPKSPLASRAEVQNSKSCARGTQQRRQVAERRVTVLGNRMNGRRNLSIAGIPPVPAST